ncbi:MAG: TVP38/TMEM64 family protein [Myxococcota bacterium]
MAEGLVWTTIWGTLAASAMMPLTAILVWVGTVHPGWEGFAVGLFVTFSSSGFGFGLGRVLGTQRVRGFLPDRLLVVLQSSESTTTVALAAFRFIPIAHFGSTNLAMGAVGVSLRNYAVSTVFGMTPIVGMYVLMGDRVQKTWREPGWENLLWLGVYALAILIVGRFFAQALTKRPRAGSPTPPP